MTRKIIDMETLEIYNSMSDAAKKLNCTPSLVFLTIIRGNRAKGRKLEYLDFWIECMTAKEKERYTRKNNIYFL